MGLFNKIKAKLFRHNDWCGRCQTPMQEKWRQLYFLPVTVDHYYHKTDAAYFKKNLYKVSQKSEIPTGYHACGIMEYQCPQCGWRSVNLTVFLPVRKEEMYVDEIRFENGEMDDFIHR